MQIVMIVDARDLENDFTLRADLCIVGTGAAGLTLAMSLNESRISVCLLESGGFERESETQDLYRGEYAGSVPTPSDDYLVTSRLRYFGGTTNHWGGLCRPLEPIDFEVRDWVPNSGWPFQKAHLDPYYRRASEFMQTGVFDADNPDEGNEALPSTLDNNVIEGKVFRSRAKRFGSDHREEIVESRNIQLVHHANAVEIVTNESEEAVEHLRVATLSGLRGTVRARFFVLATGGIENCRLLMVSDSRQAKGVGNRHDLVGRYFMEHPVTHGMGPLFLWPDVSLSLYNWRVDLWGRDIPKERDLYMRGLGPKPVAPELRRQILYFREDVLRRYKLLTTALLLSPMSSGSPSARAKEEHDALDDFGRSVMRLSLDIDRPQRPKVPYPTPQAVRTIFMCEHAPNPESRVTLTGERDALGMRRVRLAWKLTRLEIESQYRFAKLMGRELAAAGKGRMKYPIQEQELMEKLFWGWHHMGTTRMSRDPKRGVVDPDCRVHGLDNLYVGGSSVFPTSGAANPTFTIVALAIRMGDHLKRRLAAA